MNQTTGTLKNDLKKFGLNPSEWNIEQLEEPYYQIANVNDHQFYFLGESQQVGFYSEWLDIKLLSL